jgi:hypothetical protein
MYASTHLSHIHVCSYPLQSSARTEQAKLIPVLPPSPAVSTLRSTPSLLSTPWKPKLDMMTPMEPTRLVLSAYASSAAHSSQYLAARWERWCLGLCGMPRCGYSSGQPEITHASSRLQELM